MAKQNPNTAVIYRVGDGIDRINGKLVPDDRIVELTPAEARYDLALGRLKQESSKPAPEKPKGGKAGERATGGTDED